MWFKKKEKTKLQLLNESVADLVKKSNDLIYDLGKQDSILHQALVEIGAPDKPCGVGCADANPKTMLPNDT